MGALANVGCSNVQLCVYHEEPCTNECIRDRNSRFPTTD